ncbi:MAG: hypothetical protein PHI90_05510 [Clostridia bacterium]|nr:hypothetical protein [Clostridia bacterium]MDD4048272.1 hypothetical protein [Clostridia bacterium]
MNMRLKKELIIGTIINAIVVCLLLCNVNSIQAAIIEIDTFQPIIMMEKVNIEQAVAGSEFTLNLAVRNVSTNPGFNLALDFSVDGNEENKEMFPFTLKSDQETTIDKLDGNENRTVALTFTVDPDAQNKEYQLNINLKGQDAEFRNTVSSVTSIAVPVTYDVTKPILMVKSVSVSPEDADITEGFETYFQIVNLSKTTEARNVMLLLDGGDNFEVIDISNRKNIAKLLKGGSQGVTYKLRAKDTKTSNTVDLKISFDYLGSESEEIKETITLPLPKEEVGIGETPRVIINKYTLSDERVLAGNTVNLSLYIENTNKRAVKNVKISLGVIKIEESSSGGGSTTTTGGTVFSPVNSSNSFYIDYIPGKTVIQKNIDLYVDPNASAKTYIVPVDIKYEDRQGETLTCEELVNIPVTQECKLEVLSVDVASQGFVGQPVPIAAEFVNVGKAVLGNFIITMEGDFNKEDSTYYVGNLDIGVSDFYQGTIISQEEGALEGKLVFAYIDNNNKEVRVEKPFSIEIGSNAEPPQGMDGKVGPDGFMEPGMPMNGEPDSGGGFVNTLKTKWLTILLVLVVLFEAIYIIRVKRKKASEEFFDE